MDPGAALARWDAYAFTRALRAVDPDRVAAGVRDAPDGPLRGLLYSVKDLFPVAGVESCAGSLLLAGSVPERDPALIAVLRAAGAVVLGKGVCAEFGFGVAATENRLDGRVRHFSDPALSPGGSSGGDAVAVGAGLVDFAVAGDYGGSVRWPAQAAGVLGLRLGIAHPLAGMAATGRIGLRPPAPPRTVLQCELETAGLLARTPAVLRAVLAALAGGTPPDGPAAAARRLIVTDGTEIAAVRPAVAAAMEAARDAARRAGYRLVPASDELCAALREAAAVYAALRAATDDLSEVRRLAAGRLELLCGPTRAALDQEAQRRLTPPDPAAVARLRGQAAEIGRVVRGALRLAGAQALLLPAAPSGPARADADGQVAGQSPEAAGLMAHCRAVSLTGLPALAAPAAARQSPAAGWTSVQLVGADHSEDRLCAVAADLACAGFGPAGDWTAA